VAILKHIASKNADYGKSLEYLMFEHTESGSPVRNAEGDMIMREGFILDGINCSPYSYDKECEMLNAQVHKNQKYSDIKSHHYIISFDPQDNADGKLTAGLAHELGMRFARKHFPGHQILVCTHTDGHNESGNIHVHIIFNSVRKLDVEKKPYMEREIDCRAGYKHHLTKGYLEYLQAEVMEMCERQGLHQVDLLSPAKSRITDKEYRAHQRGQKKLDELNEQIVAAKMKPAVTVFQTQKQFLRDAILDIISKTATVDEFKAQLKEKYGIEVKERRGRFSYLHPERNRFITGHALGSDFEKEHVELMILKNYRAKNQDRQNTQDHNHEAAPAATVSTAGHNPMPAQKDYDPAYDYHADPVAILYVRSHLRLVVDLQTNIKAQQSAAYARKVKISNLKEMARTVVYVQEHGYDTREDLLRFQAEVSGKLDAASSLLREAEAKLKEINEHIHYTGQYYASKAVQAEFLKTKNKKNYREAHRTELDQYNEAVRYFKENAGGKVPAMKSLKTEKEQLQQDIEKQKALLSSLRREQKELQTASSNIDAILGEASSQIRGKRKTEPEL
jgi:hypothetical protein